MINTPSWDEYFLSIAEVVKTRSKDPSTQVGSIIVDDMNRVIGLGFNGMPQGFPETEELWNSKDKYHYVIHAECNALLNTTVSNLSKAKLYTTLYPCPECAKLISGSGIKTVVTYKDNKHPPGFYNFDISKEILKLNNIEIILI